MKESVQAALSLVQPRREIGVKAEDFRDMDIHVHVPPARCRKMDRPPHRHVHRAASLFTNTPVRRMWR